ncbi:TRAP transporter large permease [Acidobacteriota bacterium]
MIDSISVGILGCVVLFILLCLGMPIAFAMFFVGLLGIFALTSLEAAFPVIAMTIYHTASNYHFTLIPLFILMGGIAEYSGLTEKLYRSFDKLFSNIPGGLGVATIAASATIGTIAIPEMRRFKYAPSFSTGIVAAGGTLSFLIPPSLGFIVYGMLTEQSAGKLFVAGIIPGILLASAFIATIIIHAKLNKQIAPARNINVSFKEKISGIKGTWEAILIFILVVGGIYRGYVNPTEAGAVGVTALIIIVLLKKKYSSKKFILALFKSIRISVMVLFLIAGAHVFSTFLALTTIPMTVSNGITGLHFSRYIILALIILIYLFLGCFLDAISMMVLTMPVIFPIIISLNFNPIWFGVICVIMMEAGLITPPLGLNAIILAGVSKDIPIQNIYRGSIPFLLCMIIIVIILTVFPEITTFLPRLMGH